MGKITETRWGSYNVLSEGKDYKIKTLHIEPGKSLSDQRHFKRNEHWFILEGELSLNGDLYHQNDYINIPVENWHQPANISNRMCVICEIQYGEECIEEDIERR